jgi:hypothetical protein
MDRKHRVEVAWSAAARDRPLAKVKVPGAIDTHNCAPTQVSDTVTVTGRASPGW